MGHFREYLKLQYDNIFSSNKQESGEVKKMEIKAVLVLLSHETHHRAGEQGQFG